jgi:inosine-uridine nucleoside N-ribohydrolase
MVKVILDTDIGSDIDDAVCLAYLLAQPDCELLGITTVSGEPVERAKIASVICKQAGKDIPIYPGIEPPFLVAQRQPRAPQKAALSRWAHETEFPQGEAIEWLRRTIRANPGEVTLLAIGPMTNIGALFSIDPEIPMLLKSFVMMIGAFTFTVPRFGAGEWNGICDPHAAAMVYHHRTPQHRSIGLDVTLQVEMPAEEVRQRFQTPLLLPVLDFAEVWFHERKTIVFHDPLAATTLFDDDICTFTRGKVDVELTSPRLLGVTHWHATDEGPHEVALSVDAPRFFDHYFGLVR